MKKTLFFCAALICAMTIQAQNEISIIPEMKKGDVRTYVLGTAVEAKTDVSLNSTLQYTVVEASKKGYVVEQKTLSPEDGSGLDIKGMASAGSIANNVLSFIKDTPILINMDKDGAPVGIKNYEAIKKATKTQFSELVSKDKKASQEEKMVMQGLSNLLMDFLTEESILDGFKVNESVLTLNGKTIKDGDEEVVTNFKGFKTHKSYAVEGSKVTVKSKLALTKEETKQFLSELFTKIMPDMAPLVMGQLDMMIATGKANIEVEQTSVYEIGEDGWVKVLTIDTSSSAMGEKSTSKTVTKLKIEE